MVRKEVKAEVVKVKGKIRGSIRARKVELETGAHVKGDIVHSSLQIQPNAVFEGQVKHADDPLRETGPQAATASDSAYRAEIPSMNGGSPTAFDLPTESSRFGLPHKATLNTSGRSEQAGIL